jgi:hypothetical protein
MPHLLIVSRRIINRRCASAQAIADGNASVAPGARLG